MFVVVLVKSRYFLSSPLLHLSRRKPDLSDLERGVVYFILDPYYFRNEMKEENEILIEISRNREIQQYMISINERIVQRL
jgi:hypothetical protein